jgi:asparagine synthase (glutamine-hydrolysing)
MRNPYLKLLKGLLTASILQNLNSDYIGILYSGGVDSSILLKILIDEIGVDRIIPVAVGEKGGYDIKNALNGAKELRLNLNACFLNKSKIDSTFNIIMDLNIVSEVEKLGIAIPLFIGMNFLSQNKLKCVFLGQGADELFGGYKKYTELYRASKRNSIQTMMESDLLSLINDQLPMEKEIANYFGLRSFYPFLSPEVIKYAQSVPIDQHIINKEGELIRKAILRKLAVNIGLSVRIANQPKKALQYGSGTVKLLRKLAKDAGFPNLPTWFEDVSHS